MKGKDRAPESSPRIVPGVLSVFLRYIGWSLKRHFHAVRLELGCSAPQVPLGTPLIVYVNHASWWDPLVMMWLGARCYPGRPQYGPIEAVQLERYGIFKSLGVFGVEKGTSAGARAFLRTSESLLARPGTMLWLTPQGRFADVRERPVRLAAGIAHLAARMPDAVFVPLAFEYGFGQERLPEIYVRFGVGQTGRDLGFDSRRAQEALELGLQVNQEKLSAAVITRNPDLFELLLSGAGGVSLPYDMWRRIKAFLSCKPLEINHSNLK